MTHEENEPGHRVRIVDALRRYGGTTALSGIDLEVEPGQFLVLLGPSGSGKSTLIRSLAGIDRLDGGEIWLGDRLVSDRTHHLPPERRDLAMVFQDYALWPHLTVSGNVGFALRRRHLSASDVRGRVAAVLERVGLSRLADRYPYELSGGEQQRVALARAVVAQPKLLLFDEPLSNLDADLRERLRVEIATLTRDSGATAVYITHDQSEAFALADRVGVLDSGQLVQVGAPEVVYSSPATPFVARFTGVAGELVGRVTHSSGGYCHLRVGDVTVRARTVGPVRGGDPVRVLIRPSAARIVPEADALTAPPTSNRLPGTVVDVAYRGRGYDHVVDTGTHQVAAVFDPHAHPRGTKVTIELDAEHCMAYTAAPGADGDTANRYPMNLTTVTLEQAALSGDKAPTRSAGRRQ